MKALTFTDLQQISYETIADPKLIESTDAIVSVKQCCICGSDLHVYYGRERGMQHHTAMGHEFAGEIVEVGKAIKKLKVGDRVMSPFTTNCGNCYFCQIGLTCRCIKGQLFGWIGENGQGLQGGQAEHVRVPLADSTLKIIPDGISVEEALLLGDVLSTGFYCASQAEIKKDGVYVVIGCGPVGLMAVCSAIELGAKKVFALDTLDERLTKAKEFGAIPINAKNEDATATLLDATQGRGADASMEAVGSQGAGRSAYELVRPGGIVSVVGVCNDPNFSFSPVEAYNKNLTFKVGRSPAGFLMNKLVPIVRKKEFAFTSIFTHRMKLSEGVEAYDIFANKKDNCLKVILDV